MIEHRTGSLFDAPAGVILAHACNAKGVWGSGIAKQFKERFPDIFEGYAAYCCNRDKSPNNHVGQTLILHDRVFNWDIACMLTSYGYGKDVDPPEKILEATELALVDLLMQSYRPVEIHMPKINSGLFNVPWEKTEAVLVDTIKYFPECAVKIVVWTPAQT